jgi:hypothetical protein
MTVKKKIFWATFFVIVTAVAIVLCVGFFSGKNTDYDGTLVKIGADIGSKLGSFIHLNT